MQSQIDALLLNMREDSYLMHGGSLLVGANNRDMFIPSVSIAADYMGQKATFAT